MPVPEIDRLAHEILDILGGHATDPLPPKAAGSVVDRALVAIAAEICKVDATPQPIVSSHAKRLQPLDPVAEQLAAIGNRASSKLKARPVLALLGLYAALERAEMQERATPTPNLDANEKPLLPRFSNSRHDMRRHEEDEGTTSLRELIASYLIARGWKTFSDLMWWSHPDGVDGVGIAQAVKLQIEREGSATSGEGTP